MCILRAARTRFASSWPARRSPTQTLLERELRRLTELAPIQYDKERRAVAKKLGVRAGAIDKEIESRRQQTAEAEGAPGVKALFPPIEPYDGEVNGHELVEAIRRQIRRYVVMDKHALTAAALWVIHTHAVDAAFIAPILLVSLTREALWQIHFSRRADAARLSRVTGRQHLDGRDLPRDGGVPPDTDDRRGRQLPG